MSSITPENEATTNEIAARQTSDPDPLLEVLDNLIPPELHALAWAACSSKRWYFGHGSNDRDWSRFWKMDLDGDSAFDAIWQHVRPHCETLTGSPLRVIRQYANGHTYGLGGNPHFDDKRPGTFTFLYYPNPEWKDGWEGETVFYDQSGEIALAVRPRPNRAILFDSRILHGGRAPSRTCPALRVTVAYKLEVAHANSAPLPRRPHAENATESREESSQVAPSGVQAPQAGLFDSEEVSHEGPVRVYRVHIRAAVVDRTLGEYLANLGKTVRLPGFRSGQIPASILQQRYGSQARSETLNRLAREATERLLPQGSIISALEMKAGAETGDLDFQVTATHLPDLPLIDFAQLTLQRLTASQSSIQEAGLTPEAAVALFQDHLKLQVMDRLDAAYRFRLLPSLVERELSAIKKAAQGQLEAPPDPAAKASMIAQLRTIAERRLRLGLVIGELARRYQIRSVEGAELEDRVIDRLIALAHVEEREASEEELHEMMRE